MKNKNQLSHNRRYVVTDNRTRCYMCISADSLFDAWKKFLSVNPSFWESVFFRITSQTTVSVTFESVAPFAGFTFEVSEAA